MLFDPAVILEQPFAVLATVFIIVVGKSLAAFLIGKAFRRPTDTAVLISASLAQVGEFSFVLAALGVLPTAARDLILAGAVISIVLNPLLFLFGDRMRARRAAALAAAVEAERQDQPYRTTATGHVIVVGYGRIGRRAVERLDAIGQTQVIIEDDRDRVEDLRRQGRDAILGNAVRPVVLNAAGLDRAQHLLVAVPNALVAGEIVSTARRLNPSLRIVARAQLDAEVDYLLGRGADRVLMGEREVARLMVRDVEGALT